MGIPILSTSTNSTDIPNKANIDLVNENQFHPNLFIDGGMQIAQCLSTIGTEVANPASTTYPVFDLMKIYQSADGGTHPNVYHSKQNISSGELANASSYYRVRVDGAGSSYGANSYYLLTHKIAHGTRNYCGVGKKITLSFYAKSDISNKKIGIYLYQFYGSGGSPTAGEVLVGTTWTLSTSWTRYTYTFTTNTLSGKTFGTNFDDSIEVGFGLQWGSSIGNARFNDNNTINFIGAGNIEITNVQVEQNTIATTFTPVPYQTEFATVTNLYFRMIFKGDIKKRLGYVGAGYPIIYDDILYPPMINIPTGVVVNTTTGVTVSLSSARTPGTHTNFVLEADHTTSDNVNWGAWHNWGFGKDYASIWMSRGGTANVILMNFIAPYNLFLDGRW